MAHGRPLPVSTPLRRLGWFLGLWVLGVVALAVVALLLHVVMGAAGLMA